MSKMVLLSGILFELLISHNGISDDDDDKRSYRFQITSKNAAHSPTFPVNLESFKFEWNLFEALLSLAMNIISNNLQM